MLDNRKVIIDTELKIADTGVAATSPAGITASAAATIDGVAKVYDTGNTYTRGMFVVDIHAIQGSGVVTNCQLVQIALEGSNTAAGAFTAWVRLASFRFGMAAVVHGRTMGDLSSASTLSTTLGIGRYMKPFHNDFHGTIYQYLRVYTTINGSLNAAVGTPTIEFQAYLSKL